MSNDIVLSEKRALEEYYNAACKSYGVACKAVAAERYVFSGEQDVYFVFSPKPIPEDLDVKKIFTRNERSNVLFYPDYHVVKMDEKASPMVVVQEAVSFCKTVKFLRDLYSEHGLPLPAVIRGDEIGGLKEHNAGRNNMKLSPQARGKFDQGIKKFFKQEKTRSKYLQEWRVFMRSDKFDRKANVIKMFSDFSKRKSQITTVDQLHETNDDLKTAVINEHEFVKFKRDMAALYPDVLYAVSDIEVQNEGYVKTGRSVSETKSGAFGKLVTYEQFCNEREKRFADEGYAAIQDLTPAYYETRQLTYKEVDEPFVSSVLNSIRFAYAKSNALPTVKTPGADAVSMVEFPVEDMMNFVSLAKENKVPFYLDCFGKFGDTSLETVRVVYNPHNDAMMDGILSRMVKEKFECSHINTSIDRAADLDLRIKQAKNCRVKPLERSSVSLEGR